MARTDATDRGDAKGFGRRVKLLATHARSFVLMLPMFSGITPDIIAGILTVPPGAVGWQIAFVLGLLAFAIVLFATEKVSVDVITLCVLLSLLLAGILKPAEAFRGFASEAVISLAAIFVISGALTATGVLDLVGSRIMKLSGGSERRLVFVMMVIAASISGFMNNTTVTAMFAPAVVVLARRSNLSPSKLLMPLAFASILGGMITLIGTSTNIAVDHYLREHQVAELTMFEVTPVGLIMCAVGIAYMIFIGRRFLPEGKGDDLTAGYSIREYISEIVVLPGSPLVGQRSFDSDLSILEFRILKVIRGKDQLMPDSRVILEEGDTLLVEGKVENLMKVKRIEGIEIKGEIESADLSLKSANFRIVEMLVTMQSDVSGRTLKEADFRAKYNLTVLAIYRHGQSLIESIGDVALRVGDVLLVQGADENVSSAREKFGLSVLDEVKPTLYHPKRGLYTVGLFLTAIIASTFDLVPLSVAFLLAALGTVFVRAITPEKAYEFIDWRLIILIAGMTAFGQAMTSTMAADYLANLVISATGHLGPFWVMAGFFFLTILLTQPMSNAAAALVVLPIAMRAAQQMGASEHSFAMAIMLAASISFITPFEPSCLLVYGPGKYRFRDYVKVGGGLTLALAIILLILIPIFWPLTTR